MVKGQVSPLLSDLSPWHPINSLSLAIAAIHTSDSAHVFQIWIHLYIYIYTCIQFMVEIQEKNPTVFPPWIQIYSDPWYFPARHAERQWYQRLDRRRAETVPGKSPCFMGKSTSNGNFRKLCWFTGGYTQCRPRFNILLLSSQVYYWN